MRMKRLPVLSSVIPEPQDVLYVKPMTGQWTGQGRRCNNCFMWVSNKNRCLIHRPDLQILGTAVCGYHVPGKPVTLRSENPLNIEPVSEELSGLVQGPEEGTMCGNCTFFSGGFCNVVAKSNKELPVMKQPVDALGCCTRWKGKS